MEQKEIARTLAKAEHNPVWENMTQKDRDRYCEDAKALCPLIEAEQQDLQIDLQMANDIIADYKGEIAELKAEREAPKELMDCVLGDRDFEYEINNAYKIHPKPQINYYHCGIIARKQIEKCQARINNKIAEAVKAERERSALIIRTQLEGGCSIEVLKDFWRLSNEEAGK